MLKDHQSDIEELTHKAFKDKGAEKSLASLYVYLELENEASTLNPLKV